MGKNLGHQDLVWVVPCVSGIDYPVDSPAEAMTVKVLGKSHKVDVQYHVLRNITYVLLDAPVFRARSKAEPYPARFDDLDSAIYYSVSLVPDQCTVTSISRYAGVGRSATVHTSSWRVLLVGILQNIRPNKSADSQCP